MLFNLLNLLKQGAAVAAAILHLAPATPPARAAEWGICAAASARRHGIKTNLLVAVVQRESQWRPEVVSNTNDWGLGQLHCPGRWCGRTPTRDERAALLDACTNLDRTAWFLRHRGLRAYNPGSPHHENATLRLAAVLHLMFPEPQGG